MTYELSGENPTPFKPGTFVTAEISKKRVTNGPNTIKESDIPENVLKALNQQETRAHYISILWTVDNIVKTT